MHNAYTKVFEKIYWEQSSKFYDLLIIIKN